MSEDSDFTATQVSATVISEEKSSKDGVDISFDDNNVGNELSDNFIQKNLNQQTPTFIGLLFFFSKISIFYEDSSKQPHPNKSSGQSLIAPIFRSGGNVASKPSYLATSAKGPLTMMQIVKDISTPPLYKGKSIYEYSVNLWEQVEKEQENNLKKVMADASYGMSSSNLMNSLKHLNNNILSEERPWTLSGANITGFFFLSMKVIFDININNK
jgi:hypothetical protein